MSKARVVPTPRRLTRYDEFADERPPLTYGEPDELCSKLPEILVFSDPHFGHLHISDMQNRPEQVDALMIQRWKLTVGPNDLILVCGDVAHRCTVEYLRQHVPPLPGKIHLIRGNHDSKQYVQYFSHRGWILLHPFETEYRGWHILFTHRPVPIDALPPHSISVHGHYVESKTNEDATGTCHGGIGK